MRIKKKRDAFRGSRFSRQRKLLFFLSFFDGVFSPTVCIDHCGVNNGEQKKNSKNLTSFRVLAIFMCFVFPFNVY